MGVAPVEAQCNLDPQFQSLFTRMPRIGYNRDVFGRNRSYTCLMD